MTQNSSWLLFAREIWRNPRNMGAVCPSSKRLARAMAHSVPLTSQGLVLELGAGTGVVTEALLQHGVTPERLVSIEISSQLVHHLKQRFPKVHIIAGNALHLKELLKSAQPVSVMVSSLPFRSLPQMVRQGIVEQIDNLLPQGGLFIQFTYDLLDKTKVLPHHFQRISTQFVWNNLPPARVDTYQSKRST